MKQLWHLIEPKGKNAPERQTQQGLKHKKSKVSSSLCSTVCCAISFLFLPAS